MNRGQDGGLGARLQNEIESFLAEVTGQKPQKKKPSPEEAARQQQERRARRRQQAEAKQKQEQQKQQKKRSRSKPSGERKVGSGINEHVEEYISKHVAEHIDNDVDEYVEATIVDSVEDHLGNRNTEMPTLTGVRKKKNAAKAVADMLRDPTGIRNAILINEILKRPDFRR